MIKVSIIIPIYNVESYLHRCLDSLVNQTLKDIEIICINDCSPDNCLAILKEYAEKDKRIKIISFEKNQGVSIARNCGIEFARGEYIGFVDSDDYVDLDYYEKLCLKARETNADIVHANKKQRRIGDIKEYIILNKRTSKRYYLITHWQAIYRNAFLKKYSLKYPIGIKLSQDVAFVAKALYFANKVESINNVFYHYINRENSSSNFIGRNIHESYGIFLIFDFINETITDREEYANFFDYFFRALISIFSRVTPNWRKIFVQDIVNIYKARKYSIIIEKLPKFLEMKDLENADVLYKKLSDNIKVQSYPKIQISNLNNRKLYIWGAGRYALEALIQCDNNGWKVKAFLDSNAKLKKFQGYKVLSPQSILNSANKDFFIVISSVEYAKEISKLCRDAGLEKGRNFWSP